MFHSRKNIATLRRSSQRRKNRRFERIQRQVALELVVSNACASRVHQSSGTVSPLSHSKSTQATQQGDNEDFVDFRLSMSYGSLNISDFQTDIVESAANNEINITTGIQSNENLPSSLSFDPEQNEVVKKIVEDDHSSEDLSENDEESSVESDANDDDDDDEDLIFNSEESCNNREFTSLDIALSLSLLKSRHSLTNTCISNICRLLKVLRVPNCPTNFRIVRSLICNRFQRTINGECLTSCPSCHKISSSPDHCTSTSTCISRERFVTSPTMNHILQIEPQIRAILERNTLIRPQPKECIITDIVDTPFYRKILRGELNPFITLLMNSDGAVVKSISRSIWITTFVINELPPSIRFNRENLVIGMASVGSSKPTKDEMQIFLGRLVKQLIHLEQKGLQYTRFDSSSYVDETIHVYLVAATCDMPATSLLLNHTETNGYFGCHHCKIMGENVKIGDGSTRVFVYDVNNNNELRCNDSYDEAIRLLEQPLARHRRASINSINNGLDGLKGPCALRALKYFDVYQSFTCDTLHTLYEGVTSRMFQIFFGNISKKSSISNDMSIKKFMETLASTFKSTFYPSSTFRIPRDLKLHSIYKANELKMALLFGFPLFKNILSSERYDHFRCLAFAAHFIEASQHGPSIYLQVQDLLYEFDKHFETFYTKQQAKPVVHAMNHFGECIRRYGPAQNYSTFEFESAVAELTRTIHNGNKPTVELLNNIDLLQQTWLATTDPSFPPEMKLFDRQIQSNMRYSIPTHLPDLHRSSQNIRVHKKSFITSLPNDVSDFIRKFTRDRPYLLYGTIFVNNQRYSADSIEIHRSTHDGCVLYDRNGTPAMGFIETIVKFIDSNDCSLIIRPVILQSTADILSINNRIYSCTNVLYGTSHGSSITNVNYTCLMQKLAFRYGTDVDFPPVPKSMFFFQFPNRRSST